jgi:hypothetical protein
MRTSAKFLSGAKQDIQQKSALARYEREAPAVNLATWLAYFAVAPREAAIEWAGKHGITPELASRRWFEFSKVAPAAHFDAIPEWGSLIEHQAPALMSLIEPPPNPIEDFLNPPKPWVTRYNEETTWDELLIPDGWQLHHTDQNGEQHWTRPGKALRGGSSATTGYKGLDKLKVFSGPSWLVVEETYTRWAYMVFRDFDGDFTAASRIYRKRYGL